MKTPSAPGKLLLEELELEGIFPWLVGLREDSGLQLHRAVPNLSWLRLDESLISIERPATLLSRKSFIGHFERGVAAGLDSVVADPAAPARIGMPLAPDGIPSTPPACRGPLCLDS
mmetsp:Transcript_38824/g.91316  ORF Transcript_38824/g.91316 Transcript_38824/m.91316 type:complete len:116 (-) Transcript_38824:530-877(-)